MNTSKAVDARPLRLWPGVMLVIVQWLLWLVLPLVVAGATAVSVMGALGLRPGRHRLVALLQPRTMVRAFGSCRCDDRRLLAASRIADESIAKGAMGMLLPILAMPVLSLALVAWAVASRGLSNGPRRATMAATILLACASLALIRTGGFTGDFDNDIHWRWTPTPEERLLAEAVVEPAPAPLPTSEKVVETPSAPTDVPTPPPAPSPLPATANAAIQE